MSNVFTGEVPGFKPSLHGFKFVNSFQLSSLPLGDKIAKGIGQSSYGLCGGMAHCAHELFNFKEPISDKLKVRRFGKQGLCSNIRSEGLGQEYKMNGKLLKNNY